MSNNNDSKMNSASTYDTRHYLTHWLAGWLAHWLVNLLAQNLYAHQHVSYMYLHTYCLLTIFIYLYLLLLPAQTVCRAKSVGYESKPHYSLYLSRRQQAIAHRIDLNFILFSNSLEKFVYLCLDRWATGQNSILYKSIFKPFDVLTARFFFGLSIFNVSVCSNR